MSVFHVVVARYKEEISWLFDVLRTHEHWRTTVYNDGDTLNVPSDVCDRVRVLSGDGIPAESTKYLRFIIDNYETFDCSERLIFTQADPIYHNSTFCEVLKYTDQWNVNFQNLCFVVHPPPWGCARQILDGSAPNITYFSADARVWSDPNMDDLFNGSYHYDPWVTYYNGSTSVSELCSEWGITRPEQVDKCYAALFSTNWTTIRRTPLKTWQLIHDFNVYGNKDTSHMTQKMRACILECMWAVFFS
jgi:hypothetical protein